MHQHVIMKQGIRLSTIPIIFLGHSQNECKLVRFLQLK